MTERRPGQWPIVPRTRLTSVPAPAAEPTPAAPPVVVPVPEVQLVVTVDLTGRYDRSNDVTADLYEQTRYSTDCHTAIVRLGEEALRCGSGLGQAIAARFFLAARRIEVHVPAGTRWAFVASDVRQHLRHMTADHEWMLNSTRASGG